MKEEIKAAHVEMHDYVFQRLRDVSQELIDKFPELERCDFAAQFMPQTTEKRTSVLTFSTALDDDMRVGAVTSHNSFVAASSVMAVSLLNPAHAKQLILKLGANRFFDEMLPKMTLSYPTAMPILINVLESVAKMNQLDVMDDPVELAKLLGLDPSRFKQIHSRADDLSQALMKLAMSTTTDEEFDAKKYETMREYGFDPSTLPRELTDGLTRDNALQWLMERSDKPSQAH